MMMNTSRFGILAQIAAHARDTGAVGTTATGTCMTKGG